MNKFKNLKISTRISIATLASIATSVIMIIAVILIFRSLLPDIYGISRVDSNKYSTINQLQWAQTINSINRELADNDTDDKIKSDLDGITKSISELGSEIYIAKDGKKYFANTEKAEVDAHGTSNHHCIKPHYVGDNIKDHHRTNQKTI